MNKLPREVDKTSHLLLKEQTKITKWEAAQGKYICETCDGR